MCPSHSQHRKVQCQSDEGHEGMHINKADGRTTMWTDAAGYIPKPHLVNFIIPDNFRAVKRK